jgi:uncharacterized membrane protein
MNHSFENAFTNEDIEKNKVMALLAYILFFIPLLAAKDSPFAKFHANQGLILFLTNLGIWIISVILDFIPVIGFIIGIVAMLAHIGVVILAVIGILNAVNGKSERLPLIGNYDLIK